MRHRARKLVATTDGVSYKTHGAESSKSEKEACQKVINKLEDIANNKDMYFILGTTLEHHQRRLPNPFTIVGLFYPPVDEQLTIL